MTPLSIIGLFCEDIREESGGTITLIGLLPDNIHAERPAESGTKEAKAPTVQDKFLNKLCIYVRANFDVDDPVEDIELSLLFPDGQPLPLSQEGVQRKAIAAAKKQAKESGLPLAGIYIRAVLAGFKMQKGGGAIQLLATVDGVPRLIAALNFKIDEEITSSSDPQQPS